MGGAHRRPLRGVDRNRSLPGSVGRRVVRQSLMRAGTRKDALASSAREFSRHRRTLYCFVMWGRRTAAVARPNKNQNPIGLVNRAAVSIRHVANRADLAVSVYFASTPAHMVNPRCAARCETRAAKRLRREPRVKSHRPKTCRVKGVEKLMSVSRKRFRVEEACRRTADARADVAKAATSVRCIARSWRNFVPSVP